MVHKRLPYGMDASPNNGAPFAVGDTVYYYGIASHRHGEKGIVKKIEIHTVNVRRPTQAQAWFMQLEDDPHWVRCDRYSKNLRAKAADAA
jgi:hypothetical protein